MKRFWTRSTVAMLFAAAPFMASAQEPAAVDVLKPVDVLLSTTTPTADPADELQSIASDVYALASGDIVTLKAAFEPISPADSQNDPTQATATWVAQTAPARDAFEERIARLEAQVAALAAQLKSNASVQPMPPVTPAVAAPRAAVARTAPAMAPPTAIYRVQAPSVTAPAATYSYSLARPAQAPVTATTTATASAAPGAPIVIHIYVHGSPGAPAAAVAPAAPSAYYYSVPLTTTPAGAPSAAAPAAPTTAPVRVRARAVPATPAVPPASANPATLPSAPQPTTGVFFVPATPAIPATPAVRALPAVPATPSVPAVPALPGVPGIPAAPPATSPPSAPAGSFTPTSTSQIAWDDVPSSEK